MKTKKIEKMTDEQCLETILKLLDGRVTIETHFIGDSDGNVTHQVLQISAGDLTTVSQPERLGTVMRPATGDEIGVYIN